MSSMLRRKFDEIEALFLGNEEYLMGKLGEMANERDRLKAEYASLLEQKMIMQTAFEREIESLNTEIERLRNLAGGPSNE